MALQYKKCPDCGSKNVIGIVYGMPSYELFQEAEQGKVKLGGCVVGFDDPEYACKDCGHEWNKRQIIDDHYAKIVRLKAVVGGFFGPSYEVDLDFFKMQIKWTGGEPGDQEIVTKAINEHQCKTTIEHLKMLNLLNWKSNYSDPNIRDGTQWSIDIEVSKTVFHKYGSNRYPKEWGLFCDLLKALTGREFN